MTFAQSAAEAQHQVDALEFAEPVLERLGHLVSVRGGDGDGAACAELGAGQGAVSRERAVAQGAAELVVLGSEHGDGARGRRR